MKMSAVYNTPPLSHSENEVRFVFGHPVFRHPNVFKLFCSDCLKKNRMVVNVLIVEVSTEERLAKRAKTDSTSEGKLIYYISLDVIRRRRKANQAGKVAKS